MWGSVLDDITGYRSRQSSQPPTPDATRDSRRFSASLSRRFSFHRRHSQMSVDNTSVTYTPPPRLEESVEDPLAAAGAALPSPPLPPCTFNHPNDSSATEMSQLQPLSVTETTSAAPLLDRPTLSRPLSFAPDTFAPMSYSETGALQTSGSERPPLTRHRSRRERIAAGFSRTFSYRATSSHSQGSSGGSSGTSSEGGGAGLGRGTGSIYRRSLRRTASGRIVRMATAEEIQALEDQRASQKHPYSLKYDYMGSMAYCDGAWFDEDLEYS